MKIFRLGFFWELNPKITLYRWFYKVVNLCSNIINCEVGSKCEDYCLLDSFIVEHLRHAHISPLFRNAKSKYYINATKLGDLSI